MQAFQLFFEQYHLSWGMTLIGFAIILGSLGTAVSWIVSLARGLQVAAASPSSRLPKGLQKTNRHHMPYVVLILQA
ncbi:amino acid permease, partial [Acinetobacter baumannii]